ncbi:MAG: type III pantothenate kinase [Woeseiaceae bacterium]
MAQLLLDIGNTRIKWGVSIDGAIEQAGSAALQELPVSLPKSVDAALACSVAGDTVTQQVADAVASQCGVQVSFVTSAAMACGVTSGYDDPGSLGVDRWAALIGARSVTDSACIVVDAGTAITIDALDANGQHLGGQILPGLGLMSAALGDNTSDLPQIAEQILGAGDASQRFGRSTIAAISEGILGAAAGAIERATAALDEDAALLLTGGNAMILQQRLTQPGELREHLVLEGLARLSLD